ncbi:MAG: hypothetical protein HKM04_12070 [Legionellales bacterium]|nr:hypothetical protein [Legionellales bacterium]
MMKLPHYKLGIDVGGTTVDLVVIDSTGYLVKSCKIPLTDGIENCIIKGIKQLFQDESIQPQNCLSIHIGTTIALNSLLEISSLYKVGLLRIAGHYPDVPPAYEFPARQRQAILTSFETISGGREVDNQAISILDRVSIIDAIDKLLGAGTEAIGIISVFSPLYSEDEIYAENIIRQHFGEDIVLTLSSQLGGLGFIERENNTLVNTALKKVMKKSFAFLAATCKQLGFQCDYFITQNNGTLISLEEAVNFPLKTLCSGATNSLIGASKLAGLSHAIMVDIGGTSTDIGIVENSFPRTTFKLANIGGIPLNFHLPDISVLALGGGSIINELAITDQSLGYRVFSESRSVGGEHLTLFDIGNLLNNKVTENNIRITSPEADMLMKKCLEKISHTANELACGLKLPVVLVGGGAETIPDYFLNDEIIRPAHFGIANAYGAALAEISGVLDQIVYLDKNVEETLYELEQRVIQKVIAKGAAPGSVRLIEKTLLPLYYMPNQMTRVVMVAAGILGM